MKTRLLISLIILMSISINVRAGDFYKRHYIIIVDQTPEIQREPGFGKVYQYIKDNLTGEEQDFIFDEKTDEISLYSFGLVGSGTSQRGSYKEIHLCAYNGKKEEAYKLFVDNLITNEGNFRKEDTSIEEFLENNLRPLFEQKGSRYKSIISEGGAVTFSKYVYPVILEDSHFDFPKPAADYFIIIASNFQSGLDDIGTSQDGKILKDMLANNPYNLEYFDSQLNRLKEPFYQIPIVQREFQSSITGKDAKPAAIVSKLALHSLAGAQAYIASDVNIKQKEYASPYFTMGNVNISFYHKDELSIDSIKLNVCNLSRGTAPYSCIIERGKGYQRNTTRQTYDINERTVAIGDCKENDTLLIEYAFYTRVLNNNGESIMPIVYTADRELAVDADVFSPQYTLFQKMLPYIITFIVIAALITAVIIYYKRGKSVLRGITMKIWPISKSRYMELENYTPINLDCWYMKPNTTQQSISVTGKVAKDRRLFAKDYTLKVEYCVLDADSNDDFSFRPGGLDNSGGNLVKDMWYEIGTDSEGNFDLTVIAEQTCENLNISESVNIILQLEVKVRARLYDNNGNAVSDFVTCDQKYQFVVKPEFENRELWMAFDPGTTGSCVAYGYGGQPNDQTNIHLAYHKEKRTDDEKMIPIFPSKLKILDDSSLMKKSGDVSINDLIESTQYGGPGDYFFGNLAEMYQGRNSFQSIKKLLGYKDQLPLRDDKNKVVCHIAGKDLALLLVKGLCNHFVQFIKEEEEAENEREKFFTNGEFKPSRAIVAIPNNYTIVKAQDMVESISRTGLFREVHYIYEAESIMMLFLRDSWSNITKNSHDYECSGRYFIVYDMGGATINATIFSIEVIVANESGNKYIKEITLKTKARIGYNVGGDDIDYAWIQILYEIPAIKNALEEIGITREKHIERHRNAILKFVKELKLEWMGKIGKPLSADDINRLWAKIAADTAFPGWGLDISQGEIDDESKAYIENEWNKRDQMNRYVFTAVEEAVTELLSDISDARSIDLIMSGRTTLYPGIREQVEKTIEKTIPGITLKYWEGFEREGKENNIKTAVARGACWYAMFSNFIKIKNNIVPSTLGYIDLKDGDETFVPLIAKNSEFDENGKIGSGDVPVLTPNLTEVEILQMFTSRYQDVVKKKSNAEHRNEVMHLFNTLEKVPKEKINGSVKSIAIETDNLNQASYAVKTSTEEIKGSCIVSDSDVKSGNTDAYSFHALPSIDDVTDDGLTRIRKSRPVGGSGKRI